MVDKRSLVNSVVHAGVSYNARIDPASASAWCTRDTSVTKTVGKKVQQQGISLTALEAQWGADLVKIGLERGDVWQNSKGLYVQRSEFEEVNVESTDKFSVQVQGAATMESAIEQRHHDISKSQVKLATGAAVAAAVTAAGARHSRNALVFIRKNTETDIVALPVQQIVAVCSITAF